MAGLWQAGGEAITLGIWTATNPCPMATSVAAVAFLGRRSGNARQMLLAGLLYAAGNTITYVALAMLLMAGVHASPLADLLERHVHQVLGPVLVVAGMLILGLLPVPALTWGPGRRVKAQTERWGIWGALPLGIAFALAFCPVSAACFFVSVFRLSTQYDSWVVLPSLYGIGTALPVLVFAFLLALSTHLAGSAFRAMSQVQWWVQRGTGITLLLVGMYLSLRFVFGIF